eukprot:scaffold77181_cov17-Tisochrysis_lutea.AAC.3
MFECESNGEYLVIQRIALERTGNDDEDDDDEAGSSTDDYLGPEFDDLDDTLQQGGMPCCLPDFQTCLRQFATRAQGGHGCV